MKLYLYISCMIHMNMESYVLVMVSYASPVPIQPCSNAAPGLFKCYPIWIKCSPSGCLSPMSVCLSSLASNRVAIVDWPISGIAHTALAPPLASPSPAYPSPSTSSPCSSWLGHMPVWLWRGLIPIHKLTLEEIGLTTSAWPACPAAMAAML